LLKNGKPVKFEQREPRIFLTGLLRTCPDSHAGIVVLELEFESVPEFRWLDYYPQPQRGVDVAGDNKI
jgi:hypothetical protein